MSQKEQARRPPVELDDPLLQAKLRPPPSPPATVSRPGLINRLRASAAPIVLVAAPPGYGKTTLLSHWIERDDRPSAWVSLDEQDDDPAVLLSYVAASLDRALGGELSNLEAPDARLWSSMLSWLAAALSASEQPIIVVLDRADAIVSRDAIRAVCVLADHLPRGSALALACRNAPGFPTARFRANGRLFELGADDLAMSVSEARVLLRRAGARLSDEQAADLAWRTEGWPAGLYLSALSAEEAGTSLEAGAAGRAHDRFIVDYLRLEVLSMLSEAEMTLLTRSSVLERFSRSLCAAVLGPSDDPRALEQLETSGCFLVPLDDQPGWYRFRRPFHDVLRAELERREPTAVPALASRAADWCEGHGMPEEAIGYAHAAGDTDRVARLVSALWFTAFDSGGMTTLARWLDWLDDDVVLERFPAVAVARAWMGALTGRETEATCLLDVASRNAGDAGGNGRSGSIAPLVALVRAAMFREGVAEMKADAQLAVRELAPRSPCRPTALLLLGISHLLAGDEDEAGAILAEVTEQSSLPGGAVAGATALAERALLAIARGDDAAGETLANQARRAIRDAGAAEYPTSSLVHAATAESAVRRGDLASVRHELARATELLSRLGDAIPWLSAQIRLELARVRLAIADEVGARADLAQVEALLRRRPRLETLAEDARGLRRRTSASGRGDARRTVSLTSAELRLIPLLSTHLSFREIGERLFVSRNTVKTQSISVYRKLGVSSRSEAIARATELGLVSEPSMPISA